MHTHIFLLLWYYKYVLPDPPLATVTDCLLSYFTSATWLKPDICWTILHIRHICLLLMDCVITWLLKTLPVWSFSRYKDGLSSAWQPTSCRAVHPYCTGRRESTRGRAGEGSARKKARQRQAPKSQTYLQMLCVHGGFQESVSSAEPQAFRACEGPSAATHMLSVC